MNFLVRLWKYFNREREPLSKSLLTLIIAHYEPEYIIFDRQSGQETDSCIEDYDAQYHHIWIENEDRYREMFALV